MDELEKLYGVVSQKGLYTKSLEEFKAQYSNSESQEKLFKVVSERNLYTKSKDEFIGKYFAPTKTETPKKKENSERTFTATELDSLTKDAQSSGSLATSQKDNRLKYVERAEQKEAQSFPNLTATKQTKESEEKETLGEEYYRRLKTGSADLGAMIASVPETVYNFFSIPQNYISEKTGVDFTASADKFKEDKGIKNTILEHYVDEVDKLEKETEIFNENRYQTSGIYENITKGNYTDAFELLGSGVIRSAPVSLAMMAGGATLNSTAKLTAITTPLFVEGNRQQLKEENPEMSEAELGIKSLGMAGAETLFASIGTGTIGSVYKDILLKEGKEKGVEIFKNGLIQMYKSALKKYGSVASATGEGIEEVATTITQNMISGKEPFENVADSFLQGVGGGTLYGAPLTVSNVKNAVTQEIDKTRINKQLKNSEFSTIANLFDFEKNGVNGLALDVTKNKSSKKILEKQLELQVKKGETTKEIAEKTLSNFDDTVAINNQFDGLELSEVQKTESAKLLIEKNKLTDKIKGKDEYLVSKEKSRINEINETLKSIVSSDNDTETETDSFAFNPEESEGTSLARLSQPLEGLEGEVKETKAREIAKEHTKSYFEYVNTQENSEAILETDVAKNFEDNAYNALIKGDKVDASQEETSENGSRVDENGNPIQEGEFLVNEGKINAKDIIEDEVSKPIELEVENNFTPPQAKGTFLDGIDSGIYEYTDPVTGNKLEGDIFYDGQEIVFTDGDNEFSLGTIQDALEAESIPATKIIPKFNIQENGSIEYSGNDFEKGTITPQQSGAKSIRTDKDGNIKRVVVTHSNGNTISVKGNEAVELANVILLDLALKTDGGLETKINTDAKAREVLEQRVDTETKKVADKKAKRNPKRNIQERNAGRINEATQDTNTQSNGEVGLRVEPSNNTTENTNIQPTVKPTTSETEVEVKPKELTEEQKKQNSLVDAKNRFNRLSKSKKRSQEGLGLKQTVMNLASDLGFKVVEKSNKLSVTTPRNTEAGKISFKEQLPLSKQEDVDFALVQINSGILNWDNDVNTPRIDLGLSRYDITKGGEDLLAGKQRTIPAKRLVEALRQAKEDGFYNYIQGSGGNVGNLQVPLDTNPLNEYNNEYQKQENTGFIDQLTDEELNILSQEIEQSNIEQNGKENDTVTESSNETENSTRNEQQPNVQEKSVVNERRTKQERIKIANAKIDDFANALKSVDNIFGIKIKVDDLGDTQKQGFDIIDTIANIAKQGVSATITIDEAIKMTIAHFKANSNVDFDVNVNDVKDAMRPKNNRSVKGSSFEQLANNIPNSGELSSYMSGETIEKYTGSKAENNQDILKIRLKESLAHGVETIETAKELFGENFVFETLDYVESSSLSPDKKSLIYISLENELDRQLKLDPPNKLTVQKQLNIVREESQKHSRQSSIAINYGRLRSFALNGYNLEEVTDAMFSTKEKKDRLKIEKALQSNMDDINKEAEAKEQELEDNEYDFEIEEVNPKKQRSKKKVVKDLEDVWKAMKRDVRNSTKDGTLSVSIPYAKQLIVATPHILKATKLLVELGGYNAKEIVEAIHENIKESFPNLTKKDVSETIKKDQEKNKKPLTKKQKKLISQDEKQKRRIAEIEKSIEQLKKDNPRFAEGDSSIWAEKISELEAERKELRNERAKKRAELKPLTEKQKKAQKTKLLKDQLIEAGFSREITVTRKSTDENGNQIDVKEKRQILDWKKLAGREGSVENIQKYVEDNLRDKGVSEQEIQEFVETLKEEFVELRQSIIEKGLKELDIRNKKIQPINRKTEARRLAELYNYGLFDKKPDEYNQLMNSLMGLSPFEQTVFNQLQEKAKILADLYASGFNELSIKTETDKIQKQINDIVHKYHFKLGGLGYKTAALIKEYSDFSTRLILHSLGQIIQNPASGIMERAILRASYLGTGTNTKELSKARSKMGWTVFNDIVKNQGGIYGDVESSLFGYGRTEDRLNNIAKNKAYNVAVSAVIGRFHLEAPDSLNKIIITKKKFEVNLIKILTDKSNPNGAMTKQEALRFVSDYMTGQSFEDAKIKAEALIDKINSENSSEIPSLPKTKESILRLADGIVKEALVMGKKLTQEQVEASYKSAYRSAGFDIGHEPNNLISRQVQSTSRKIDKNLKDAIKEKNYFNATLLTIEKAFYSNIVTTFVGGGTNWVVLTAQKAGLDLVSPIFDYAKANRGKIDLTTEEGVNNLEETLLRQSNLRSTKSRLIVGGLSQLAIAMLVVGLGYDDELEEIVNKNKTAKKYFAYLAPTPLAIFIGIQSGSREFTDQIKAISGVRNPYFDNTYQLMQSVDNLYKGYTKDSEKYKEKGYGTIGNVVGSKFNAPISWRTVRDIQNVYLWLDGKEPNKVNYKGKGFWDGYLAGGFIDFLGLRPNKENTTTSQPTQSAPKSTLRQLK